MGEPDLSVTQLYEKMLQKFPEIHCDVVRRYVLQYPKDEKTCTQILNYQRYISKVCLNNSNFGDSSIVNQFADMKLSTDKDDEVTKNFDRKNPIEPFLHSNQPHESEQQPYSSYDIQNASKNSNRSISDAGLPQYFTPRNIPNDGLQALTAPASSENFYGFAYPFESFLDSDNYLLRATSSNNDNFLLQPLPISSTNHMMQPIVASNNHITQSPLIASNSHMMEPPIVSTNDSFKVQPTVVSSNDNVMIQTSHFNQSKQSPSYRNLQSPPTHDTYIGMPQFLSPAGAYTTEMQPLSAQHQSSTMNFQDPLLLNKLRISPEQQALMTPKKEGTELQTSPHFSDLSKPKFDSQLHINVQSSDNTPHDWRPNAAYSPNTKFQIPPRPIKLSPNFNNQFTRASDNPLYQNNMLPIEQGTPQLHLPPTSYWKQSVGNSALAPFPPVQQPYLAPSRTPVSSSQLFYSTLDAQKIVNYQRQMLNVLQFEMVRINVNIDNCKMEISSLEEQWQDKVCLPNKEKIAQLSDENSKLRIECHCLCMEVDQYLKGKARLGEINDDFYNCLDTGQQGPIPPGPKSRKKIIKSGNNSSKRLSREEDEENKESNKWKCSKCTFANHPAITICEICQVARTSPALGSGDTFFENKDLLE